MGKDKLKTGLTTRFIVPFYYDRNVLKFYDLAGKSDKWAISNKNRQESDIHDYIMDGIIVSSEGDEDVRHAVNCDYAMACNYDYKGEMPTYRFCFDKASDDTVPIKIRKIGLSLFENGIGFLWYEVFVSEARVYVDFVNCFKELVRKDDPIVRVKKLQIEDNSPIPEDARNIKDRIYECHDHSYRGLWILELLGTLGCNVEFIPNRQSGGVTLPDKALIFNHAVFAETGDIAEYAFRLTKGYNSNYKVPAGIEQEMLKPFENVYYYASGEGCGYYTYVSDVNVDAGKIMKDYFTMYLLALHQVYSLLRYSKRVAQNLPISSTVYLRYSPQLYQELQRINTEINTFLAKNIYASVSFVQHQNDFYNYLITKLRVRENVKALSAGIDALRDMQGDLETEKKARREKRLNLVLAIVAILGVLQSIVAAWDIYNMFIK